MSVLVASYPKWVLVWPGCAIPQDYEWFIQEGPAMYTDVLVEASVTRVSFCDGKGMVPSGDSSHCKLVALE
jgi:hypothetical protein